MIPSLFIKNNTSNTFLTIIATLYFYSRIYTAYASSVCISMYLNFSVYTIRLTENNKNSNRAVLTIVTIEQSNHQRRAFFLFFTLRGLSIDIFRTAKAYVVSVTYLYPSFQILSEQPF